MVATSPLRSHQFSEGQYCQQAWKRSLLEFDRCALRKTSWRMTKLLISMLKAFALLHYTPPEMFHVCSRCVVVVVMWDGYQEIDIIGVTQLVTSRLCDLNPRSIVNAFQQHVTASFIVKNYRSECENKRFERLWSYDFCILVERQQTTKTVSPKSDPGTIRIHVTANKCD